MIKLDSLCLSFGKNIPEDVVCWDPQSGNDILGGFLGLKHCPVCGRSLADFV